MRIDTVLAFGDAPDATLAASARASGRPAPAPTGARESRRRIREEIEKRYTIPE
ncbi:MAG: hypothetical protein ACE15D_02145 [Candidatus Eisenbacteria bacterium]